MKPQASSTSLASRYSSKGFKAHSSLERRVSATDAGADRKKQGVLNQSIFAADAKACRPWPE
jgi:hypothetical protein